MRNRPDILPGLLLAALFAASCSKTPAPTVSAKLCAGEITPIGTIQGDGYYSPFENREVAVGGIVTYVDPDGGFYLEEPGDGTAGQTSRALFVASETDSVHARPGMRIHLSGTVEETGERRDKLTTISNPHSVEQCSKGNDLPLTHVNLPLGNKGREALEGMRVTFGRDLVITKKSEVRRRQIPPDGYPGFKKTMDAVGEWVGQTYRLTKEGK